MRRPVLSLVLLASLTFLFGLGRQAITDSDEAYYAEAAREMVERGDWLTPHFNYEYRWEKPVLYYWLTAATYLLSGPAEWAARLWSALSGVGLVLLTWSAARHFDAGGGERVRWLAAAIVATCFGYFAEARLSLPDLPLAFCITLAITATFRAIEAPRGAGRGWWICAGAGAGIGFLMKGPVALVVAGVVLLPVWWRERRRVRVPLSGVLQAAAVCAGVAAPWYLAMIGTHGLPYVESFFINDNFQRFATERYNERRPLELAYYLPILLGGVMPWSAFLIALPLARLRAGWRDRPPMTDADWRLLLWAVMPLLFFTASIGKQPRYILPVLPPVAILLARAIISAAGGEGARGRGAVRVAAWTTAATFLVLAALLARAAPMFINAYSVATWVGVCALCVAAAAIARDAYTAAWQRLPVTVALAAATLLLTVQFGAMSGRRPEAVEQIAALVHSQRSQGESVGVYEAVVRNLVFYTHVRHERLDSAEQVATFLARPERVLLVLERKNLDRLGPASGVRVRVLGRVPYLNAANFRVDTLLWPNPARDIEELLLVSNR